MLTVPLFLTTVKSIEELAKQTAVDITGLTAPPAEDGSVGFFIGSKGKTLPVGFKYTSDVFFVPESTGKLTTVTISLEHTVLFFF